MTLIKFYHHCICATVFNGLASLGSYLIRNAGKASNEHERLREIYRVKCWEWFDK